MDSIEARARRLAGKNHWKNPVAAAQSILIGSELAHVQTCASNRPPSAPLGRSDLDFGQSIA